MSIGVDLSNPDVFGDAGFHDIFADLRRLEGLYWNEEWDGPGFWAVVRYRDAMAVVENTKGFTSQYGSLLTSYRNAAEPGSGRMLVMTDPPRHGQLRAAINRAFTPRMVRRLEARLSDEIGKMVMAAVDRGRCEFVSEIAARVPVALICEMMGVPPADWQLMYSLTSAAFSSVGPIYDEDKPVRRNAAAAHTAILEYYNNLLAERRRSPGDDLVSMLVTARVGGEPLTDEDILLNCDNLIVGGNETVRHAASGGLLALLENENQYDALRGDPSLVDSTVEEVLRWTSPGMHVLRTATEDVGVASERVRRGDQVVVWIVSANRDEQAFVDGGRFDVTRSANRHLTFGVGEHYCLGAALARLELRILFRQLAHPGLAIRLGGPARRIRSVVVSGLEQLPVTVVRRR